MGHCDPAILTISPVNITFFILPAVDQVGQYDFLCSDARHHRLKGICSILSWV